MECSEDDFDRIISVSLKGMYLTCKWALPVMEATAEGRDRQHLVFRGCDSYRALDRVCLIEGRSECAEDERGSSVRRQRCSLQCDCAGRVVDADVPSAHNRNRAGIEDMMRSRDDAVPMLWQG